MPSSNDIHTVVQRYAKAWAAKDITAIFDSYHDDVVFHYFGRSPLAGTHRGKTACLAALKQLRDKTARQLLAIRDVLSGEQHGVIIVTEQFEREGKTVVLERLLRYSVREGKISECWVYDEDQRLVDDWLA